MKKLILFLCLALPVLVHAQKKATVAYAANMQFAMQELKKEFEKETGITVELISGASGKLSAQIAEGAPYDVFVSADMKFPGELYRKGLATAAPRVYAIGKLVVWTMKPGLKPSANLDFLLSPDVKKIAIANPQTAPYGTAAVEALKYYHLYDRVKDKLVTGENIGQAQQFIATGAADAGFIARSMVLAEEMKGKGAWAGVDGKAYAPIEQGAVVLTRAMGKNGDAANKFYKFLYSATARAIFEKNGYVLP